MQRPTFSDRIRYAFDRTMSKGTPALIAWLAVATLVLLVAYVVVLFVLGLTHEAMETPSLSRLFWFGLMRAMDSGTMSGDQGTWPFLVADLFVTLGGIFVLSSLIGILNAGLTAKLENLRKGRSIVVEENHTLVLGWSPSILTILDELVRANENKKYACIVVLSPRDKVEMEDAIRERLPDTKSTRIVCRSGCPSDPNALAMVNVNGSKAVLVLSPEGDDPDVKVVKALLAITNGRNRREAPYHVVAELTDARNASVAKMVGKDEVEVILTGRLISQITVQTCRQSGLSVVHTELLDFDGDEIYFGDALKLVGKTFGEILSAYDTSAIIGIADKDAIRVLPPMDTILEAEDRVIAISRDDDTVVISKEVPVVDEAAIVTNEREAAGPEKTLVLGWNRRAPGIVEGLDAYVAKGSHALVVADDDHASDIAAIAASLANQSVEFRASDTTDRRVLDGLGVTAFDHVIVLCSDELPSETADARVLVTLLHLREIAEREGRPIGIVSEMRDVRNRELAEVTRADDFIVSDKLVSLMMCQVAENKHVHAVLEHLFDPAGAEVYVRSATDYVKEGASVTFHTVVESARRRGESAIGYRIASEHSNAERAYGIVVNPDKRKRVTLGAQDKVIVVAES